MLPCLLCMMFGAIMFVDPEGSLDKMNGLAANLHRAVDASIGARFRFDFKDKPLKNPRRLVIAVRVFGGAIVAIGTLSLYSSLTGQI